MKNDKLIWYQSVLDGISNVASRFIGAFKKNGFIFSFFTMMVFIIVYTLIVNPVRIDKILERKFDTMLQTQKEEEVNSVNKRIEADRILGNIMTKITEKFPEVQRIILLESHNSVKTLTNTDILYMSATMEMLTSNSLHLQYISEDLQKQIRHSLMGQMLNTLKYKSYLYFPDIASCNHPDHKILFKLKAVGDKEALLIPYLDKDENVQIVMVITGIKLPIKDMVEYTNDFKEQIERCLM